MTRAVVCHERGNADAVRIENRALPPITEGEVRIAVCASGVSFANLLVLAGTHQNKPPLPFTPGTEVSGIVVECASGATRFRRGDRVAAAVRNGGFAEQVIAPEATVYTIPDSVDHRSAVQIPTIYGTAYGALKWRARVAPGETVLVHGAAGGSGLAAIEVAKCLEARVVAVAGSAEKVEAAKRHGADIVINRVEQDFRDAVLQLTGGRGADVIFDPVGGEVFTDSMRCVAPDGRIIPIGFAGGTIPSVPANIVLVKNIDVLGVYWGYYMGWAKTPAPAGTETRVREAMAELFEWCRIGRLKPETWRAFPLEEYRTALDCISSRSVIGRVVLEPMDEPAALKLAAA